MRRLLLLACLAALTPPSLGAQAPVTLEDELGGSGETFPVEVAFEVAERQGYMQYRPLPGIAVELGMGPESEAGWGFPDRPALASLESGVDGIVRATLEVPTEHRGDPDLRFFARVVEPGWQRAVVSRGLGGYRKPLRITPRPGGTLHGTVLDTAGGPVEGAAVGIDYGRVEGPFAPAKTDHLGRFTLHWTTGMAAGEVRLVARKAGLGAGESPPFRPAAELWRRPLELRLAPGARLAGRVVDPRGRSVPGLTVTARPSSGFPPGSGVYAGEGRAGLLVAQTTTDARGAFELGGMAPGGYSLFASASHVRLRVGELGALIGTLAAPSGEASELVFAEPRLEVVVVNHDGSPADVEAALAHGDDAGSARLQVCRLETLDARLPYYPPWVYGRAVENRATFPAEPGASYLVVWSQPGVPLREVRVRAGLDPLTPVQVRLEPPAPPSRVTFRVLGPDGTAPGDEPAVEVTSVETGLRLATTIEPGLPAENHFRGWNDPDGETWTAALPPGRYRAHVWVPTFLGCVVPHPFPRTPLRPVEREFELLPGEDLALELQLGAAGHLDLEPLEPAAHITPAEVDALVPASLIDEAVIEAARARHGGAFVALAGPDGERHPASEFELGGGFSRLSYDLGWVVPGHQARGLTPLPPGEWTLRVERPGELLLERPVTIAAGEVTTVRW